MDIRKHLLAGLLLISSSQVVLCQGLDEIQEKRVLGGTKGNSNFKPENPSGLDRYQEKRVQSDKYTPIPDAKPSGGGLDDAEMEQRGLQKN